MPEFKIEGGNDKPQIQFNAGSGELFIKGRSLPEDAFAFYQPVIEWLCNYAKTPASSTVLNVNLEYFNTASAKQIFKIVNIIAELGKTSSAKVIWHYDMGDRDMESSGKRFSKLCNFPFEVVQN